MTSVVVLGMQWGDEGKGKVIDYLSEKADIIVRFQGGHNAGHTVVADGVMYKLSLLPSGIIRRNKLCVIGCGVVLDPFALVKEIGLLKDQGVSINSKNLMIADNTSLILSFHRELDSSREAESGGLRIGTTCRGIGPAYEDKVGRRALRLADLIDFESLPAKMEPILRHHNAIRTAFSSLPPLEASCVLEDLLQVRDEILPYAVPAGKLIELYSTSERNILFEGAQGTFLDIDHGTYPFVTSSNTIAGQAAIGAGVGPGTLDRVLGVTKAYTTRVGEGPFPTEDTGRVGDILGNYGQEFGTSTGRKRRCGWFDAVLVRQAVRISGVDSIAITKIDVLDNLNEIKICTGYRLNGEVIDYLPTCSKSQSELEPVYEVMPGWNRPTNGIQDLSDLPKEALDYVNAITQLTNVKVSVLSTGPSRQDTIFVMDLFAPNS